MATINASISISSDIMSYPSRINKTMTMKKLGSCHGLEETTGLRNKKFGTVTTASVIVEHDELTDDKAHEVIGKLHGGDWMLFPYNGNTNITVASDGGIEQTLEYMVFADGIAVAAG